MVPPTESFVRKPRLPFWGAQILNLITSHMSVEKVQQKNNYSTSPLFDEIFPFLL